MSCRRCMIVDDPVPKAQPTGRFLTDKQRAAIQRGERPALTYPTGQAPAPGTVEAITTPHTPGDPRSADLYVEILALRRVAGKQRADYLISDLRPETLIRRSLPAHRVNKGADDAVKPPTAETIERASHDGAYTRAPHLALTDEPEHPDPADKHLKRANAEMRKKDVDTRRELRAERAAAEERETARRFSEQVRRLMVRRHQRGLDNTQFLADLERRLKDAENELQEVSK